MMINSGKKQQPPNEPTSPPSCVNFIIRGHQKGWPVDRLTLRFVDTEILQLFWPNCKSRSEVMELWESQVSFFGVF